MKAEPVVRGTRNSPHADNVEKLPSLSCTLPSGLGTTLSNRHGGLGIPSPIPLTLFRKEGLGDVILKFSLCCPTECVWTRPGLLSHSAYREGGGETQGWVSRRIHCSLWKSPVQ